MLQFIQNSQRAPESVVWKNRKHIEESVESKNSSLPNRQTEWRQFVVDFGLIEKIKEPPQNFHRELRHLDSTLCREGKIEHYEILNDFLFSPQNSRNLCS